MPRRITLHSLISTRMGRFSIKEMSIFAIQNESEEKLSSFYFSVDEI